MRAVVACATCCVLASVFSPTCAVAHGIPGLVSACERHASGVDAPLRVISSQTRAADIDTSEEASLVLSEWRAATADAAVPATMVEGAFEVLTMPAGTIEGMDMSPHEIDRAAWPQAFAVSAQQPTTAIAADGKALTAR
jgi:hypothetical protein